MLSYGLLPPDATVYRVTTNRAWLDSVNDRLLPDAFRLKKKDVEGDSRLSVIVADHCPSLNEAAEWTTRSGIRGVARLNVGDINNLHLNLSVVQDQEHHAGIQGLPYASDDEQDTEIIRQANDYAYALAEICKLCCLE